MWGRREWRAANHTSRRVAQCCMARGGSANEEEGVYAGANKMLRDAGKNRFSEGSAAMMTARRLAVDAGRDIKRRVMKTVWLAPAELYQFLQRQAKKPMAKTLALICVMTLGEHGRLGATCRQEIYST